MVPAIMIIVSLLIVGIAAISWHRRHVMSFEGQITPMGRDTRDCLV